MSLCLANFNSTKVQFRGRWVIDAIQSVIDISIPLRYNLEQGQPYEPEPGCPISIPLRYNLEALRKLLLRLELPISIPLRYNLEFSEYVETYVDSNFNSTKVQFRVQELTPHHLFANTFQFH